jgi:hypothetical protein
MGPQAQDAAGVTTACRQAARGAGGPGSIAAIGRQQRPKLAVGGQQLCLHRLLCLLRAAELAFQVGAQRPQGLRLLLGCLQSLLQRLAAAAASCSRSRPGAAAGRGEGGAVGTGCLQGCPHLFDAVILDCKLPLQGFHSGH